MKNTTRLMNLFQRPALFVLPGIATAFHAKIVEAIGFEACYLSGSGTAGYITGLPDAGLTTMTEIVRNGSYISSAIDIPLMSDADTGYGNPLNVRRTVKEFIRAGVAGIHIEDQVSPKRCGFISGKEIIPVEEAVAKYRAALDARDEMDPDFVIIARSDARTAVGGGLDQAIHRSKAYKEAGVDVLYIEGCQSVKEIQTCIQQLEPPVMFSTVAIDADSLPSHAEMGAMGISCAFYPDIGRHRVTYRILWEFLNDFKDHGVQALVDWDSLLADFPWKYPPPPHRYDLLGFQEIRKLEENYLSSEAMAKYSKSRSLYTPGEESKQF